MMVLVVVAAMATPAHAAPDALGSGVSSGVSGEPSFESALADYHAKRYATAILQLFAYVEKTPPPADLGEAEFLLGLALLGSGGAKDASFFFAEAEKHFAGFEDVAALYLVKSLERAGDHGAAGAALDAALGRHASSPMFADAPEWRARLQAAGRDHARAAKTYEALAGGSSGTAEFNENTYLAGEQWALAGRYAASAAAFRRVLDSERIDRFSTRAIGGWENALRAMNDGRVTTEFHAYMETWAAARIKASQHRQAQPALEALRRASGGVLDAPRQFQLGLAAFHNHDNDTAIREFTALAESSTEYADDARYRLGKVRTRQGDNEGSRAEFQTLLRTHPGSGLRGAAHYQLALIDMEDNRYESAWRYFDQRLTKPTGGQEEYLTWLKAWTAYRAGKLDAAETTIDGLLKKFAKSQNGDRYRYWRAAIRQARGEIEPAAADWTGINADPRSYYGMRAGERLASMRRAHKNPAGDFRARGVGSSPVPPPRAEDFPEAVRSLVQKTIKLERLGCRAEAAVLSKRILEILDKPDVDRSRRWAAAELLRMTGHYAIAKKLAIDGGLYGHLRAYSNPLSESYWPLIYPRAYDWAVSDYAGQRGVRQELVWAIMYNESRFQPHVVSPANAIGLMQIVPRTGFEIAQALGETGFAPDDLYDPVTNIRYGTWYLRSMLDRFEGNEVCAMASYNAGPDVVSKWWRNKGSFSEEIFIEEIPYKETNNYVKQVLLTYRIYQYLYGG